MMQSVPVLILVLCCMASAHRAIHYLEGRQGSLPPDECLQAFSDLGNATIADDLDALTRILDLLCGDTCSRFLPESSSEVCVRQNDKYCYATSVDLTASCIGFCAIQCTDRCQTCVDDFANDYNCCLAEYERLGMNATIGPGEICDLSPNACRDDSDTSGGAIAVPTVLTALLLMVMAAIVM